MLKVLLNWFYIFLTAASLGYGFAYFVNRKLHYKIKRLNNMVAIGLVMATVYAQVKWGLLLMQL